MLCIKCENYTNCVEYGFIDEVSKCANFSQVKSKTNFDRIKAMSVEEMAEFIANDRKRIIEPVVEMFKIFRLDKICDIAKENIKEWLETEVQEDDS